MGKVQGPSGGEESQRGNRMMREKLWTGWAVGGALALAVGGWGVGPGVTPAAAQEKTSPRETVVVGTHTAYPKTPNAMTITLKIGPAKDMHMPHSGVWVKMGPLAGEQYHFEVDVEDPATGRGIFYSHVTIRAVNIDSVKGIELELHPMWGPDGVHYGANAFLPGDGQYTIVVTVDPPTFAREAPAFQFMWQAKAEFSIKVEDGRVTPR